MLSKSKSKEIEKCESVRDILTLLLSTDVLSSMPELGTACILFCTLPVTVSSAERSFSKLKLIKSYLRSSIAQDRLDSLALISIENEAARQLDLDELVNKFANNKARKKEFWLLSSGWQRQSLQISLRTLYQTNLNKPYEWYNSIGLHTNTSVAYVMLQKYSLLYLVLIH